MEEQILQKIKKEYLDIKEEQKNLKKLYDRLLELENNELVKEYLFITEKLQESDLDKKLAANQNDIISKIYYKHLYNIKQTNGIYIYLGTYKNNHEIDIVHGSLDERVNKNNKQANYILYQDIEKTEPIQIPIQEAKKFESENIIIFPDIYLSESYYYEVQRNFFNNCVIYGQEEALKKVKKLAKKENN